MPSSTATEEDGNLVVVLVHPYSILEGCQGLLKGMAQGLANHGFPAVSFDMRGAGRSSGRPFITGSSEINDVIAVCQWATQNLSAHRILLVDSSAGAPIAGSAVDQIKEVVGSLIWCGKKLNEVNGDTVYMAGNFKEFKVENQSNTSWDEQNAMTSTADYLASIDNSKREDTSFDSDLQLAIALQQQEFEQQASQRQNNAE